jgi:peptide/nickel transport system substrate-binding protein
MALTIDRQAFIDILGEGQLLRGGAMMPPPFGIWGMPKELQEEVPGYGLDVEANREKARAIMREVGYGPDNRLSIKVTTRNIASYRDASVILIDHLKQVYIDAELDPIETATWYGVVGRKAYQVGMNIMGVGIDDPDVVFFENYACGSQRNYTGYCNKDIQALMEKQSAIKDIKERQKLVWEIDRELQLDHARPMIYWGKAATCWQPYVKDVTRNVNSIYNAWRMEDWWLDK